MRDKYDFTPEKKQSPRNTYENGKRGGCDGGDKYSPALDILLFG